MAVSAEYVHRWKTQWDEYWPTLDDEGKECFGLPNGPPGYDEYLSCHFCGGPYTNFKDYKEGDCPDGCTIGGILARSETL